MGERPRCPFQAELDPSPTRAAIKDRLLHSAIPLARAFVRYAPLEQSRQRLWQRWVEPYLAWHAHPFEARTVFGPRIAGTTFDILQQHVYYFGVWEPILTRFIQSRLAPGDTFVDVGANVGYFSMLASVLVGPSGSVVAIEASPSICRLLSRGVQRNHLSNVEVINAVVAADRGSQMVFLGPESHIGLTAVHGQPHLTPEAEVRAEPLGALLDAETLARARLIKIDVEGAEDTVIEGLAPHLREMNPRVEIAVEVHPGQHESLFATLHDAGFHPYTLEIDYSPLRYRERAEPRPRRARGPIEGEVDVIFSRTDGEWL